MLCRRYPLRATRLAADAVSPNVVLFVYYTLRATASRPSPILAVRDYVSPVADAVPMPVLLHAWRARVMCTCGRCLAFSPNVIMIPFVFKRVHKHATSHHPVQMFLQSCCTCMLSACDHHESSCTFGELASCAHVGAASRSRRTLS